MKKIINILSCKYNLLLTAIIGCGLGLRLFELSSKSIWYDEACSISFIQKPWGTIFSHRYLLRPVYFLLLKVWSIIFGCKEFALRSLSVVFGILSIYLMYKVGKKIFDKNTGIIAAFILALSTYHIIRSQQARYYTLLMSLILVAVYLFWQIQNKGKLKHYILYGVSLAVLFYTHCFAAAVFFLFTNIFYLFQKKKTKRWWICQILILVCAGMLLVPAQKYYYLEQNADQYCPMQYTGILVDIVEDMSYGKRLNQGGIGYYGAEISSVPRKGLFYLFILILLYGVYGFFYNKRKKIIAIKLSFVILWLIVPITVFIFANIFLPISKWSKAVIIVLPAFYLIIALLIGKMSRLWRFFVVALIVIFSIPALTCYYFPGEGDSWREIAGSVKSQVASGEAIVIFPIQSLAQYLYYHNYNADKALSAVSPGGAMRGKLIKGQWISDFQLEGNYFVGIERGRADTFISGREQVNSKFKGIWFIINPYWVDNKEAQDLLEYFKRWFSLDYKREYPWDAVEVYHYK
ncbi:MAG: hypothetical protein GY853_03910 [PVC group bacterium]|nr:hypothetical protein [PVC group bacterium]